jgi:predicted transposase YbfD/YdcC
VLKLILRCNLLYICCLNLETNAEIWIPNNIIMFNGANQPVLRQDDANAGDILTFTETEETFRAVNTRTVSTVETQEVDTVPLTPIVENQEENQKQTEEKRQWAFDETKALIAAVDAHYEDMHHVKKRKTFWGIIAQQLQSQKVHFSEESCKKKRANLLRTYKAIKDCKKKNRAWSWCQISFL